MMPETRMCWVMSSRPQNLPESENFSLVERPIEPLGEGMILVQNIYLSIDPTIRIWMSDVDQYAKPMQIDDPIRAFVFGQVLESRNAAFSEGDLVTGEGAWESHSILRHAERIVPERPFTLADHASVLGLTGLSAYFGMQEVGQPRAGETVVVTSAAGAVGSVAGQIAKINGCHVVGIAGGPEKCKLIVDDYGFDAAVDYKSGELSEKLHQACPRGIDLDFENVGGPTLDAVLQNINDRARIVLCGLVGSYNSSSDWQAVTMMRNILMKRARIEGFLISSFWNRQPEGVAQLKDWIGDGLIRWHTDILSGMDAAPAALKRVLEGKNKGKQLVRIAPDPTISQS